MASDPTYIQEEIDANSVWKLAFYLSEMNNDQAPIGWGAYITTADQVFKYFINEEVQNDTRI